jgi:signal recognition particle subunit SRP54
MAFNFVEKKFTKLVEDVQSKSTLNQEDVSSFLREVRLLLLEADVNLKVVKEFIANIEEKALKQESDVSKTKSQELIQIVNNELKEVLGGEAHT